MEHSVSFPNIEQLPQLDYRCHSWQLPSSEPRQCPFCGSVSPSVFLRPDKLPVAQCHLCRCFYVAVRISEEALQRLYDQYWSVTCPRPMTDEMARYLTATASSRYARDHCLTKLSALMDSWRSKTVLDVGCGFGEKASMMKSMGATVVGIDISTHVVDFCNRKLGIQAECTTIEELQAADNSFDVITMFEFAEHPIEPFKAIRSAVNKLKAGGFMVIVTPNATAGERWWLTREREWVGFRVDLEHLQYLHVDTIDYLCHTLNCRQVHLEQLGHRALDDIKTVPQVVKIPETGNQIKKTIKNLPGVRSAIYALRNFQANMQKISQTATNPGEYHLFSILQKIS